MSETNPNPSSNVPNDPNQINPPPPAGAGATPPAPKKKRKRWWLRIVLALIVLVLLLVGLAPYIAGTSAVRSIVMGQVNKNLNGSVAIDDYSIGWTGGVSAKGIKVYDAQRNLMLEVPQFHTKLSLLGAARGNFDLGDTQVDVNLTDVRIDKDGKLNLADLVKSEPAAAKAEHEKKAEPAKPIELPDVKGKLTLHILGGKISGEGVPTRVAIEPGTITLNIPDINQPIENTIYLAYRAGEGKTSTIQLDGSVSAVQNGKLELTTIDKTIKADQKLTLSNVDLSAVEPFLKPSLGPDGKLAGIASGALALRAEGITGISADGALQVAGVVLAGAGLKDTLKLDKIDVPIQITRTVKDANTTLIEIKTLKVLTTLAGGKPLANLDVSGQVQEESLTRIGNHQAPGADGTITITTSVPDFGAVVSALPNTLKLAEGVVVGSGSFSQVATIKLSNDRVTLSQRTDLSANGTRDGKPIALKPVHLELDAAAVPNGKPIPTLRDLKLMLTSHFATISGGGESLAKIDIKGNFDAAKLRDEAAQFSDLGEIQLAGAGDFAISANGDPTGVEPISAKLTANLNNIRVSGIGSATTTQPIDQPRLSMSAAAKLLRSADSAVSGIDDVAVTLQTGDAASPLVDLALTANKIDPKAGSVGEFALTKLAINDLSQVQKQFSAFVPALREQQIELKSGAIYANVAGSFDGKTLTLTQPLGLSMPNLVINKAGRTVFGREDIRAALAGKITLGDNAIVANLTDLSFDTKSKLFSIARSGDAPIDATLAKAGGVKGSGAIAVSADIKRLNDLAQNFGAAVTVAGQTPAKPAYDLRSGKLDGTLTLAQGDKPQTDVNFDGAISALTVANAQNPFENQTIKLVLKATSPDDLSGIQVSNAGVQSSFVNANVSDTAVKLNAGVWDLVQQSNVDVTVPDLPALYNLIQAFMPATPAQPVTMGVEASGPLMLQAAPDDGSGRNRKRKSKSAPDAPVGADAAASAPLDPLQITSGTAALKLNVKRDSANQTTNINLTDARISKLALRRGDQHYAFNQDINFKLAAGIKAADDKSKPAIAQQIQSLTISQLDGDLGGVARLSMPQPLTAGGLDDLKKLSANGQIKLEGTLDNLTPALAVLQGGEPLPYRGGYVMTQTIATQPQGADQTIITLVGDVLASNFVALGQDGKPTFTERQITIKNDISANLQQKQAIVRTLAVDMPESRALSLKFTGSVQDWAQNRFIRGVNSDAARLDLEYDLAKLWPIIHPMLIKPGVEDAYAELKIEGKYTRAFNITGKYPNKPTFNESIKYLKADGGVAVGMLDYSGLHITDLPVAITLEKGVARINTDPPAGAAPAKCNEGTISLTGTELDMAYKDPMLTIPRNTKLLQDVRLNPVLASSLGKLGTVILTNASEASGSMNFTVVECNRVPLGELLRKSEEARAQFVVSVKELHLDGPLPKALGLASDDFKDGIRGSIPDSTITIANGQATTNLTVQIDRTEKDPRTGRDVPKPVPMTFNGGLSLASLDLNNFIVTIPPQLLIGDLKKIAPNGAAIPLRGKASSPQLDIQKFITENAAKSLLGGGGKGDVQSGDSGLGGLLDQLGGKKKDDKKKKGK